MSSRSESSTRIVPTDSVEVDAKERAAAVVVGWRAVVWERVEAADPQAVASLRSAAEAHESTLKFLLAEAGEIGERLAAGLERYYGSEVGPRLRRPAVLSALVAVSEPAASAAAEEDTLIPRARPSITVGHTVRMNTGCGNLYVTINESNDGQPFELFNHMGKAGGCAASQNEAIGRLISYALRCGASVEPLVKQLKGISCHRPAWGEDGKISSCSDAIGKALEKYYVARSGRMALQAGAGRDAGADEEPTPELLPRVAEPRDDDLPAQLDLRRRSLHAATGAHGNGRRLHEPVKVQGACPDCGSQMAFEEGCVKCHSCGFTECG